MVVIRIQNFQTSQAVKHLKWLPAIAMIRVWKQKQPPEGLDPNGKIQFRTDREPISGRPKADILTLKSSREYRTQDPLSKNFIY